MGKIGIGEDGTGKVLSGMGEDEKDRDWEGMGWDGLAI